MKGEAEGKKDGRVGGEGERSESCGVEATIAVSCLILAPVMIRLQDGFHTVACCNFLYEILPVHQ